ncbi:MAG: hypothetical protein Q9164_000824 [Protoblastenia rupestris]
MSERMTALLQFIDRAHRDRNDDDDDPPPGSEGVGPNQLIFLGKLGADDLLRRFLRDAFTKTRFDFDAVTRHDSLDPVAESAFSAAAVLKAMIDAPEPRNCYESFECEELRGRVNWEALLESGLKDEL